MMKLTDEEIGGLLGIEFRNSYSGHVAEYLAVRDAQLKKVDEAINQFFETEPWMILEDWQALLGEIEP